MRRSENKGVDMMYKKKYSTNARDAGICGNGENHQ